MEEYNGWILIGIPIVISFLITRRLKSGCFSFGVIGMLVFFLNLGATLSFESAPKSIKKIASLFSENEICTARVINLSEYTWKNKTRHKIEIAFNTASGKKVYKTYNDLDNSEKIGDTYKVAYNEEQDIFVSYSILFFLTVLGNFIFCVIFLIYIILILRVILRLKIAPFLKLVQKLSIIFIFPIIMIAIDALLLLQFIYNSNIMSDVSNIIIMFSILFLTIYIYNYIKYLVKGTLKTNTKRFEKWASEWD